MLTPLKPPNSGYLLVQAGPLQVKGEQILQYLFDRDIRRPPVGGEYRLIQPFVRILLATWDGVVQVSQRALLQLRLAGPLWVQPALRF